MFHYSVYDLHRHFVVHYQQTSGIHHDTEDELHDEDGEMGGWINFYRLCHIDLYSFSTTIIAFLGIYAVAMVQR